MTKDELAIELTDLNLQYPTRLPKELIAKAKDNNLVIVYGASDDLMEFDGAIHDEISCYDGGNAYLDRNGLVENKCECDDCPYNKALLKMATVIEAIWCEDENISWTYKTKIPHATFPVMEEDDQYCRGIVFSLGDI